MQYLSDGYRVIAIQFYFNNPANPSIRVEFYMKYMA